MDFPCDEKGLGGSTTSEWARENANLNLQRASDLIGHDVNSRAGKDIGDIKELIVDMQTSKVRYCRAGGRPQHVQYRERSSPSR